MWLTNTGILSNSTTVSLNTTTINGVNEFIDVFIDGEQVVNHEDYTANTTAITFTDVGKLPEGRIQLVQTYTLLKKQLLIL